MNKTRRPKKTGRDPKPRKLQAGLRGLIEKRLSTWNRELDEDSGKLVVTRVKATIEAVRNAAYQAGMEDAGDSSRDKCLDFLVKHTRFAQAQNQIAKVARAAMGDVQIAAAAERITELEEANAKLEADNKTLTDNARKLDDQVKKEKEKAAADSKKAKDQHKKALDEAKKAHQAAVKVLKEKHREELKAAKAK